MAGASGCKDHPANLKGHGMVSEKKKHGLTLGWIHGVSPYFELLIPQTIKCHFGVPHLPMI